MKKLTVSALSIAFAALAGLGTTALAGDGEDLTVHNNTGHEVVVFLFQDAKVHLSSDGGTQFAHIKNGESAVAHVPHCNFGIVLVDHEDVWHAEFHDCHSTDYTFTKDTGHVPPKKH